MKRFFTFLSFFCFTEFVLAQNTGNGQIQYYTTDNGLPSNGIKGLQWDESTGFLWIATEAGIVRFNGADFKSYTKENIQSIASERMLFIIKNNAGSIYTSDIPGNIFTIQKNKPVLWKENTKKENAYFSNYYMLAVSDSLFLKPGFDKSKTIFSLGSDKIACISDTAFLLLHRGAIYFQSGMLKYPVSSPLLKKDISALFKIDNNYFITDSNNQTYTLNATNYTLKPVRVQDKKGLVFNPVSNNRYFYWEIGMENPIYIDGNNAWIYEFKNNKLTATIIFTGIPTDVLIRSIQYSKKKGILFLGTDSKGLIVLNQKKVESKKRISQQPGKRNSYYAQIELSNGNILTNEGDIIGDSPVINSTNSLKRKFTFSISQTKDSLIWLLPYDAKPGSNCLTRYNMKTKEFKSYNKIISQTFVSIVGSDTILANSTGIGKLDSDSMFYLYKYKQNYESLLIYEMEEIEPGILLLATSEGLYSYEVQRNNFHLFYNIPGTAIRTFNKIKDYIFFGTYGAGFYIYKNGIAKAMPLDKNNYLLYTHCFVDDDFGNCWISTNRGLFRTKTNELINVFENKNANIYYHYFGKKDGMDMTEMNGGCSPCAIKLKNKIISFPTMDGLLWVNPQTINPILPEGEIYIDEILVDNKVYNPDSISLKKLPSKTSEILIKLALSAWSNNENIYLDYQLNDTLNWKPVDIEKGFEIQFSNIPPGQYKLRIRKHNGNGISNYTYKELDFYITIPWYKKIWFNFLILLFISGLILLYINFRTRQYRQTQLRLEKLITEKTQELLQKNEVLEKNNSIKTRLISIISHDIVTPLKFLTAAGKNLIDKRKIMPEDLQDETILEMANTSQELQLLSTNILNWIKYQNENRRLVKENLNLYELTNQVFSVLYSIARQKKINLVNEINPEITIYQFFEALKILIYNLVSNAINFSESGKIIVSNKTANSKTIISVKDEGVGMSPEQIKNIMADQFIISSTNIDKRKGNGLGYLIIKDLLKTIEGSIVINSEKGKGTEVLITISSKFI